MTPLNLQLQIEKLEREKAELLEALGELADAVADGSEIKRLTKAIAKAGTVLAKAERS